MKLLLCCLLSSLSISFSLFAQKESAIEFQARLNKEFAAAKTSPLPAEDRAHFTALPFFPIDSSFIVSAQFIRTTKSKPFGMKTTTNRTPTYEKYGEAHFQLNGESYVLCIYQSHQSRETEAYKNYLFLPFTDATNGSESYGGGRYIDLEIPDDKTIIIDFNKAYNPYCAYNHRFSCPIPPKENDLSIPIRAGVKYLASEH